jgi:lipoprotein-anchoring transpeptidase ErfK/SrfK
MTHSTRLALIAASVATALLTHSASAADKAKPVNKEEMEAATRLQVFLDRARFAPGKIDGRYGEFTTKSLALYRQSVGEAAPVPTVTPEEKEPAEKKADAKAPAAAAPDVSGIDLASVEPLFVTYTVTEDDLKNVGELPKEVPDQATLKVLPYESAVEAIAEKFHVDQDFLGELNPGKTEAIKAGDVLTVPNVEPFDIAVLQKKPADEKAPASNEDEGDDKKAEGKDKPKAEPEPTPEPIVASVKVDTSTNMLTLYENEKLIAAYPVTIGSERTESPVGDWKVKGVAKMPNFRYDKAMLNKGERSDDFHMLPPGPNNPVGVIWIQLSKKGIGLHGTSDPDAIGRSASHGCIRLANWDIVRLAEKVKGGVAVSIR